MGDSTYALPGTLFERLKLETQPWHDRIENDLDLLRPDLTPEGYLALLARFYGFYQPWEADVKQSLGTVIPTLLERCHKTQLLRDDLQALGWAEKDLPAVALCQELPHLTAQNDILGSFYVLEGATLGGQYLARHLIPKLQLENGGCRFFSGYGAETGKMWRGFRQLTESHSHVEDYDSIVASACATFSSMHRWLCQPGRQAKTAD